MSNEAAERLLDEAFRLRPTGGTERERQAWANGFTEAREAIDEALAAERRATVERIRAEATAQGLIGSGKDAWSAILDEEAAP